jgi:hypothetical protein
MAGLPSFETLPADNLLLLQQLLRFSRTPIASAKEIPSELKLALVRTVTASDSAIVSPQGSLAPARRSQTIAASELFPIEWTENTRTIRAAFSKATTLLNLLPLPNMSGESSGGGNRVAASLSPIPSPVIDLQDSPPLAPTDARIDALLRSQEQLATAMAQLVAREAARSSPASTPNGPVSYSCQYHLG